MASNPSAEPTCTSFDLAPTSSGMTRQPDPKGLQNLPPNDFPDAAAAEPEPHERLPSRSDDN
jgi:hypothetical protein